MKHVAAVALYLATCSCAAPTLQQRQDAWLRYRDATRAVCLVGAAKDKAMPTEVKLWCVNVVDP